MNTIKQGFTLIELLVCTTILSILMSIATYSYNGIRSYWAVEETRTALYTGFFTAKNQAFISGKSTVICPSSDGVNCLSSPVWQHGWIIFLDNNKNREMDSSDISIFRQSALSDGIILKSNQGRPRLVFQANGSNGGTNATFTLCNNNDSSRAKNIIISNTARIRTAPINAILAEQLCI